MRGTSPEPRHLRDCFRDAASAPGSTREESELTDFTDSCKGRKVLLVEDSPVICEATEMMLEDMGCTVVGPAGTMAPALQLAADEPLDGAVIDINIRGGKAFSILKILEDRQIPFLLTSGYADWSMPEEWRGRPRLAKPYDEAELRSAVAALFGAADAQTRVSAAS